MKSVWRHSQRSFDHDIGLPSQYVRQPMWRPRAGFEVPCTSFWIWRKTHPNRSWSRRSKTGVLSRWRTFRIVVRWALIGQGAASWHCKHQRHWDGWPIWVTGLILDTIGTHELVSIPVHNCMYFYIAAMLLNGTVDQLLQLPTEMMQLLAPQRTDNYVVNICWLQLFEFGGGFVELPILLRARQQHQSAVTHHNLYFLLLHRPASCEGHKRIHVPQVT